MTDPQIFACRPCNREFDERRLYTVVNVTEYCPHCRSTILRQSNDWPDTQRLVRASEDIADIDAWLDRYATGTSRRVMKREGEGIRQQGNFLWSIETPHSIAIECHYDECRPQTAEIRAVTTQHGGQVFERITEVRLAAAGQGLQVRGRRLHANYAGEEIEAELQAAWGLMQVIDLGELSTELLEAVSKRVSEATRVVAARFGESRN